MFRKLFWTGFILFAGISLSAARARSFDNGDLTVKVVPTLQIMKKDSTIPFINGGNSSSFQTAKGWSSSEFKGRWMEIDNKKGTGAEVKINQPNAVFDIKAIPVNGTSAFSLDINMTASQKIDIKRGCMPTLNVNKSMYILTLPGREAIELFPEDGQDTYQLRTWAVFAAEDAAKGALMVIIPDLEIWDFSAGGSINVGGFTRGTGWTPGIDINMPDFNRNTMEKGDTARSLLIFAVVPKGGDYAKIYNDVMENYKKGAKK